MPEIQTGMDSSPAEVSAVAEEAGKVEAARAELYDEATGANQGELILGKYQSVDDLASAYQSLQAEYSRLKGGLPQQQEQPVDNQVDNAEPEADEEEESQPRVDPEQARQAQESYNRFIQQAGGEQQYQRLGQWAMQNLPEGRIDVLNAALQAGDEAAAITALKGLQYDFMMSNGYEPRLSGGRAPSSEIKGFTSEAQVVEAMNDPRYSGGNPDPAYIREVERRLAVSNVFQER